MLQHDGHRIHTGAPVAEANGATVTLMLRPEQLSLGDAGGANVLSGTIEAINFLGSIVRVDLKVGSATITLDLFNERRLELPRVGQARMLSFPPHACWVMPVSA